MTVEARSGSAFRPRDALLLGVLALVWGHSFLFIKIAVSAVAPAWVVASRMTVGGFLLLTIAAAVRQRIPRDPRTLGTLAVIGITGGALPWLGQAWAQRSLDSGLVAVLNACTPVATLIIAVLARQERLYRNRVVGLSIAVVGTVVVVRGEVGTGHSLPALLVAVLATTGYALAAVITRARISGRVRNLSAAAVQLLFGAAVLAPYAFAAHGPPPATVSPQVAAALLMLGLFGTGVAFLIYFSLIESVGATNASMVTYLVPAIGLTAGTVYRGEHFGPNVVAGAAALVGGVWLAQRVPGRSG